MQTGTREKGTTHVLRARPKGNKEGAKEESAQAKMQTGTRVKGNGARPASEAEDVVKAGNEYLKAFINALQCCP